MGIGGALHRSLNFFASCAFVTFLIFPCAPKKSLIFLSKKVTVNFYSSDFLGEFLYENLKFSDFFGDFSVKIWNLVTFLFTFSMKIWNLVTFFENILEFFKSHFFVTIPLRTKNLFIAHLCATMQTLETYAMIYPWIISPYSFMCHAVGYSWKCW